MKALCWMLTALVSFSSGLYGQARLIYLHDGNSYSVDGFDLTRPYFEEEGEKRYLPIEGKWGLEIQTDAFWDHCYYPRSYYLNKVHRPYAGRDGEDLLSIEFDGDVLPVIVGNDSETQGAVAWKSADFESSVVVLGWYYNNRVTSVDLVRSSSPVHSGIMDSLFKKFRISANEIDGFPFFCVLDQDSLLLKSPQIDFSTNNPYYIYRLACRGAAAEIESLNLDSKELSRLKIQDKYSLMHGAALYGNVEVLRYLHRIKADRIKRDREFPVIRQAVFAGRLDSVKELISQGHDPLGRSDLYYSQFQIAIQRGDYRIVDYLTDDDRYLKHKTPIGGNSLEVAVSSLRPAIFNMINRKQKDRGLKLKVREVRPNVGTVKNLFYSNCALGNLELVKAMMDLGMNAATTVDGRYPMKAAVESGNPELVKFLIGEGVNLEKTFGLNDFSYLHYAAQHGHADVIRVLVESGIDKDIVDSRGNTPLYIAVLSKKVSSVHELLELGANPNIRPERRPAAVWMAVIQDERESIQSLIQYGAECELDDILAMQLMDYALAFDIPEVVEISLERCLASDFSFRGRVPGVWVANYYDATLCKDVLIEGGANITAKPNWRFKAPSDSFVESLAREHFSVKYPKHLREKYGDLKVTVEMIIDPIGKVRFPKFLEPLPWDLRLFLRESIRDWSIDLPDVDDLNTAYRVRVPLELKSSEFGVKVFEVGELDQEPTPTKRVAPDYPPYLQKKRVRGFADIIFIVDERGNVERAWVEKASHEEFGVYAQRAVLQWKFKPGFKEGIPVKTLVRIPLQFGLKR